MYVKALFTEMLSALHQETGKVIEFIICRIDAILVSRKSRSATSHKVGS